MVYLEFIEELDNGDVVYSYMPERKDADKGIVSVNRYTRERKKIKDSADGGRWSAYHGHAWLRIEEILDAGELKKEAYAAWY